MSRKILQNQLIFIIKSTLMAGVQELLLNMNYVHGHMPCSKKGVQSLLRGICGLEGKYHGNVDLWDT